MKYLFTILLLLPTLLFAQIPIGSKKIPTKILGKTITDSSLILPRDTVSLSSLERGIAIKDSILYIFNGEKWEEVQSSGSIGAIALNNGGTITSIPEVGFNPNTTDITKWIDTVFYRSTKPIVTISGGISLELQSSQVLNHSISFSVKRQFGTKPIQSVFINGINKVFVQPLENGTYSSVQNVSINSNTDTTFKIIVTTEDGKKDSSTTTFSFLPRRYFGWVSDTVNIGTSFYDDSKITILNSEISTSKSKTFNTGSPVGSQFFVYAYYSTAGDLIDWKMNGFSSLSSMNKSVRQFTNALGYTGTWIIYWSKNAQTIASDIIAN